MIFGNKGRERFLDAVAGFEAAVRERDADRSQQYFQDMHRFFGDAADQEFLRAGPRLAGILDEVPPGPRATVAVIVGACVERGADASACGPHVLAGLAETLDGARGRPASGGRRPAAGSSPTRRPRNRTRTSSTGWGRTRPWPG